MLILVTLLLITIDWDVILVNTFRKSLSQSKKISLTGSYF